MRLVSNSSPLIALAKIGMLGILREDLVIPQAVFAELTESAKEYADEFDTWCKERVIAVKNPRAVEYLELMLGKGEAEAIALAEELKTNIVLIDDLKARKIAKLRGLNVIGTLGILLDAKDSGIIVEIRPLLEELMKKQIRISKELYDRTLELAHEVTITPHSSK